MRLNISFLLLLGKEHIVVVLVKNLILLLSSFRQAGAIAFILNVLPAEVLGDLRDLIVLKGLLA